MSPNAGKPMDKLLAVLERFDRAKIPYTMRHSRDDAVMVVAFAPGEYWEIEFLADGEVEIERFRSDGKIQDESMLTELYALWSEDELSPVPNNEHNDAITRK